MAKNIKYAIIEICSFTHYTSVLERIDLFYDSNVEITLFLDYKIYNHLKKELKNRKVRVFVRNKNDSIFKFMKQISSEHFDIIHIITIQMKLFHFLFFKPDADKIYVQMFNTNTWMKFQFTLNPRTWLAMFVRYIWKKRMTGATVGFKKMKEFLKSKGFKKPIVVIPIPSIYYPDNKIKNIKKNDEFKLVIPGMVTQERKNYLGFLESLKDWDNNMKNKIEIELLGPILKTRKSKYKKILNLIDELNKNGFKIITHNAPLNPSDFLRKLKESSVLFCPINIKFGIEIYGITKETGFTSDITKSAVPGIIPKDLNVQKEIESSILRYDDFNEVKQIINSLVEDKKKIIDLKSEALKNSYKFTISSLKKRISLYDF